VVDVYKKKIGLLIFLLLGKGFDVWKWQKTNPQADPVQNVCGQQHKPPA
jgi:hypothetical protein